MAHTTVSRDAYLFRHHPCFFLVLKDFIICSISLGPVGVKYIVFRLGELPRYDSGDFIDLGMASAYCLPILVK